MDSKQIALLAYLTEHQIAYELFRHEPLFTCEQAVACMARLNMPGVGVRNLFLKDDKKKLYLIVAADGARIDLKQVGKTIGTKGLRFADAQLMLQYLDVTPGSVTPLALMHDTEKVVQPLIDASLFTHQYIQIHPLKNDATLVIASADLLKFLAMHARTYCIYDFEHHCIVQK